MQSITITCETKLAEKWNFAFLYKSFFIFRYAVLSLASIDIIMLCYMHRLIGPSHLTRRYVFKVTN